MAGKGKPKTGGRTKGTPNKICHDVKELAQRYGTEAINVLIQLMTKGKTETVRIQAAKELLDRGYGRAVAQVMHTGKDDGPIKFKDMSNLEVARRMAFTMDKARREKEAEQLEASPTEH